MHVNCCDPLLADLDVVDVNCYPFISEKMMGILQEGREFVDDYDHVAMNINCCALTSK